jgi:hypothetical protein
VLCSVVEFYWSDIDSWAGSSLSEFMDSVPCRSLENRRPDRKEVARVDGITPSAVSFLPPRHHLCFLILARVSSPSSPNTLSQIPTSHSFLLGLASPTGFGQTSRACDANTRAASLTEAAAIYETHGTLLDQHRQGAQGIVWKALISPAVRRPRPTHFNPAPSNPGSGRTPLLYLSYQTAC